MIDFSEPSMYTSTYINPQVDPQKLGFLAIGLGGSRGRDSADDSSDWDGIGILSTREDTHRVVTTHRVDLCKLLYIERDESSSCSEMSDASGSRNDWHVLRFSGKAQDGTKRTMKLWTMECLVALYCNPRICRLGVLSARSVQCFRRHHRELGTILYAYQPLQISEALYMLEDADFLIPTTVADGLHRPNPGVTCDLLLTAVPVWGSLDTAKSLVISKWLKLVGEDNEREMIDLFYTSKSFTSDYRTDITSEIERLKTYKLDEQIWGLRQGPVELEPLILMSVQNHPTLDIDRSGYQFVCLLVGPHVGDKLCLFTSSHKDQNTITSGKYALDSQMAEPICSPFSSNSSSCYTRMRLKATESWQDVFAKSGPGVVAEVAIITTLHAYFPSTMLQNLLVFDPHGSRALFERLPGTMLSDVRLAFANGAYEDYFECIQDAFDWLVNVEIIRTRQVAAVHLRTIRAKTTPTQSAIHRFYYDRLYLDSRVIELYGECCPAFFKTDQGRQLTLKDFMAMPLVVNGQQVQSLLHSSRQSEIILDPQGQHLGDSSVSIGLGDGHGGNVMAVLHDPATIHFVDYEVAGWHSPLLDLAKPLYNDVFFSVLYRDTLRPPHVESSEIRYRVTEEAIFIDFDLRLSLLDCTLALVKAEYMLRPILDRLAIDYPRDFDKAENLLGAALFCCAFLTRNFSSCPEAFFFNAALGTLLLVDLKSTLNCFIGCRFWPSVPNEDCISVTDAGTRTSTALTKITKFTGTFSEQQKDTQHQLTLASIFCQLQEDNCAYDEVAFQKLGLYDLEPDMVFLKRFDETVQLHKRFSKTIDESSSVIIARIESARKLGMQIAPHTCIRESIFAEPRIDHHFQYTEVLKQTQALKPHPAKLVDVGCCMGSDIRKLIVDGFIAKDIVGIDIEPRFFEVSEILYNERPASREFKLRRGDVLARDFQSCNFELESCFDFVHSANVIHLFSYEQQVRFFNAMAFLAKPGGLIWGRQVGLFEDDLYEQYRQPSGKGARFTASEFKDLIHKATGWNMAEVTYEYRLVQYEELRTARMDKNWVLQWSVSVPLCKDPSLRLQEIYH